MPSPSKINFVSHPFSLSKALSPLIDTMLNFEGEFDGHGHGDVTCT